MANLCVRLPVSVREWAIEQGGGGWLRSLVEQAYAAQTAPTRILLRPTTADETDPACRWTAALDGPGGLAAVRPPGAGGRRAGVRTRGGGSWATMEEAEAAGRLAWAALGEPGEPQVVRAPWRGPAQQ